jgi:hypothetical protein
MTQILLNQADLQSMADGTRTFTIRVWDSTEETVPGSNSLNVTRSIVFKLKLADTRSPTTVINSFDSTALPNLYGNSKDNGHIEVTSVAGGAGPDVSGQIMVFGTSTDDKAVRSIWAHVDAYAFPHATATLTSKYIGTAISAVNAATDTFTSTAHGLSANDVVRFAATALPTGLAANTDYYVIAAGLTANAFEVSATLGGAAVNITSAGTAVSFTQIYYRLAYYDYSGAAPTGYTKLANYFIVPTDVFATNHWAFSVTASTFAQATHSVGWRLDWDSSYITGTALTNVNLRVVAEDGGAGPNASSTLASSGAVITNTVTPTALNTITDLANLANVPTLWDGLAITVGGTACTVTDYTAATGVVEFSPALGSLASVTYSLTLPTNTPAYLVDVVPYISGILRDANVYTTRRSKLGKYPLQQSEPNVRVSGFNLFTSTTQDANNWIRIYSANTGGNADASALSIEAAPAPTVNDFEMTMGAASRSGWFRLSVNGLEAINNIDAASELNKEDDGSGPASTLWNDNRYLSLFQVGDYFDRSDDPIHPSMSIDTNANPDRLYGGWSNTASGAFYVARPLSAGATRATYFTTYDPPEWTDLFVDSGGDRHTLVLENFYGGATTTDWGFLSTEINNANRVELDDMGDDMSTAVNHTDGFDEMLFQFRNPRIAVRGGTNDQYVSYYDYYSKCLKYSRALNGAATYVTTAHETDQATVVDGVDDFGYPLAVTAAQASDTFTTTQTHGYIANQAVTFAATTMPTGMTAGTTYYVVGGTLTATTFQVSATSGGAAFNFTGNGNTVTVTTTTNPDVGVWSDIQIDDVGVGTDDTTWRPVIAYYDTTNKRLMVARGQNSQPVGTAQWTKNIVPGTANIGEYVSMKMDASGNLHIAAFKNSTGDLYYIYAANINGTGTYTFSTPVAVDVDGAVGSYIDLDLDSATGTPIISYATGDIGTYEGLKYAYVASGNGRAAADWEYMVVPVDAVVNAQRTNIAYTTDTAAWEGTVAIGYGSNYFEIVYVKRQVP